MKVSFTRKFSLGYEKNFRITMIALVFVILKHSLQRRGEFHLYLGPVPEFPLVDSATSLLDDFQWPSVQTKIFYSTSIQISILLTRSLTIVGSAGI